MERLPEFIGNHPWLVLAFVIIVLLLIGTEVARLLRKYKELSPGEATMLINREDAAVVDVRSVAEFQEGHIRGARNVPLESLERQEKVLARLRDRPVIVCCGAGNHSPRAAGWLTSNGFERVYLLSGGMRSWQSENLPVTKGKE